MSVRKLLVHIPELLLVELVYWILLDFIHISINEDLFKKVTVLPDGKNHGLVFILDWSGSMSREMLDTVKQLYNLIWFCKKVSIPFDVYAFTNEWKRREQDPSGQWNPIENELPYEPQEYNFRVEEDFSLMNLFTSGV